MRYASIRDLDISNGNDIGVALFVQGCHFHCKNCFNKSTWDLDGGKEFTKETCDKFMKLVNRPFIKRVSILGGEPLAKENVDDVCNILKQIKNKTIWVYTGYTFETVKNYDIMKYIDYLVDGQYVDELRDFRLRFRGSSNQRIIDVQKSLKENKVILYEVN